VNKEKLVEVVTEATGLAKLEVKSVIDVTLEEIIKELEKAGRIELRGFGIFSVKERRPRPARNPRTGETIWLEAKQVPNFKPALKLKERIANTNL
jgi:nucleoid DNA-binding protein